MRENADGPTLPLNASVVFPACLRTGPDAARAVVRDAQDMETTALSVPYPGPRLVHAHVSDAMSPRLLSCDPSTPLVTVAQRMAGEGVHAIVVLGSPSASGRSPSGLVTDAVLLRHAAQADRLTAGEVASRDVLEVFPDEPLEPVARRMANHSVTHVVVLDEPSGHPVGVLSASDVVRVLAWGWT